MRRFFSYMVLVLFVGVLIGCEGQQGKQGTQGIQGTQGTQGDRGDRGDRGVEGPSGSSNFYLYYGYVDGSDSDGGGDDWEKQISLPFLTDENHVQVTLSGFHFRWTVSGEDRNIRDISSYLTGISVNGYVLTVSGYVSYYDRSVNDPYDYWLQFAVLAIDPSKLACTSVWDLANPIPDIPCKKNDG